MLLQKNEYFPLVAMEECAEIQQALAKSLRFGWKDRHPERSEETNEQEVLKEFYQLVAMFEEMQRLTILKKLSVEQITQIKQEKINKVYHYLNYSKEIGRIE